MDLEDAIYMTWQTSQDLDLIFEAILDRPKLLTQDEIANATLGLKMLHDLRMEKLLDIYKREYGLDEYTTDSQKLSERARLMKVIAEVTNGMKVKPKKPVKKGKNERNKIF